MRNGRLVLAVAALATASLAACAPASDDTAPDPGTSQQPPAGSPDDVPATGGPDSGVLRDIDVGGIPGDLFLPADTDAADDTGVPVVVMLHGTEGERDHMELLAEAVAEDGALVYVPTWPVIDQAAPFPEEDGDEPFRAQSEAVVCALRHVRRTATEHGGDPADLTVVGHSGGGMIGARVSMVGELPWPGIDCDSDLDHRPTRFIGLAGDYEGTYQYARTYRDLYAPYDVLTLDPTNTDLEVWLLHGHNDDAVNVFTSALFEDHLRAAGIDVRMLTTDSTHAAIVDTTTPAGRFTADRISEILHRSPDARWWPPDAVDATVRFDEDLSCTYDGPDTWPPDRAMTFRLVNDSDLGTAVALVSIRSDAEPSLADVLERGGGVLGVDNPDWVDWGGFRPVPPGENRTMRFALVEADQTFVVYCHVQPWNDHARAGWMYPTAVLSPQAGASPEVVHVVGDSVTAVHGSTIVSGLAECGWDARLHSTSSRRIDLAYEWHEQWVSSGIDEVERILASADPDTWILELGSNDLQEITSTDQAAALIDEVLARIDPGDRVLWITVLWPEYDTAADMFNDALRDRADIELVEWDLAGRDHLADAVHPTSEGAALLAQLCCDALSDGS